MPGRFAPTPSGRMHIGNIYAMLGAWLSARSSNDAIYLRIEDIDEPRVVPVAADLIMDDLQWLGLDWDARPYINPPDTLCMKMPCAPCSVSPSTIREPSPQMPPETQRR